MQRWHITAGLAVLAVAGGLLAPRLTAALQASPTPVPEPPPEPAGVEPAGVEVTRVETPVVAPQAPDEHLGHLIVEAGLDRDAVLAGRGEERFLTITVRAPDELGRSFRRPVDLAVVMDTSGSMTDRGKIAYARQAAKVLAGSMRPGDTYSLVTFSDEARTIIPATRVRNVQPIHAAIDRIEEGGSTNLYAGLVAGADQARSALTAENVGRVVVLSDGKANVGRTDPMSLTRLVGRLSREGVSVSTVGLGVDFDEDRLARLADVGGGSYDYVDDPRQLQQVFSDELDRTSRVVARRTRLSIDLPEGVTGLEVLGWQAEQTARGWAVDLGDVYAGETRKIVARVRVAPGGPGLREVAAVDADYVDLVDGQQATSHAVARVDVVQDSRLAERSWNKPRAAAAREAWGNQQLERSARAYQRGDRAQAQQYARSSASTLRQAAVDFGDEDLATQADNVEKLNDVFGSVEPESVDGRANIKQAKEWYLDNVR